MDVPSVITNTVTGGVLGGIFSLGNTAVDYFNTREKAKEALAQSKLQLDHEFQMAQITNDRARQQAEEQNFQTRLEGTIDEIKKSFDGLTTSIQDQQTLDAKADGWVAQTVTLFRPALTILLVVGAIGTAFMADKSAFSSLSELSAMGVAWWFGDRQRMKLLGVK